MTVRRIEGLMTEELDGEFLVYNPATQEAHALNPSAATVFELCDGNTSASTMVEEVARRTGLPADPEIVDLALAELQEAHLVVNEDAQPQGITRRAVIRRLGLTAIATAALPIVETMVVPSIAAAQSMVPAPGPAPAPAPAPTPSPTPP